MLYPGAPETPKYAGRTNSTSVSCCNRRTPSCHPHSDKMRSAVLGFYFYLLRVVASVLQCCGSTLNCEYIANGGRGAVLCAQAQRGQNVMAHEADFFWDGKYVCWLTWQVRNLQSLTSPFGGNPLQVVLLQAAVCLVNVSHGRDSPACWLCVSIKSYSRFLFTSYAFLSQSNSLLEASDLRRRMRG